jgi:hypothetical protein
VVKKQVKPCFCRRDTVSDNVPDWNTQNREQTICDKAVGNGNYEWKTILKVKNEEVDPYDKDPQSDVHYG